MIMRSLLMVFILCCVGCASLAVKPSGVVGYNNGIAIIQAQKPASKLQVEIAQEVIGGFDSVPLILYVVVENLADSEIIFSPNNLSFMIDGKPIYPYNFHSVLQTSVSVAQALQDYGIEITPPDQKIKDPFFSIAAYRPYPMPIWLHDGFFMTYRFYDYSFARASYYNNQVESYNARKFLLAHYLRKNTLRQHDVKGGFILIPYKHIKEGELLIEVQVGTDIHKIIVNLAKL